MLKWKYGNYQFAINPNSQSSKVELVGDVMRTLSGALISQPSFLEESYDVGAIFYQQRTTAISSSSFAYDFANGNGSTIYGTSKANDSIDTYNSNLYSVPSEINIAGTAYSTYISCTYDGQVILANPDNVSTVAQFTVNSTGNTTARGSLYPTAVSGSTYYSSVMIKKTGVGTIFIDSGKPYPEGGNSINITALTSKSTDMGNSWFKYEYTYKINSNTTTQCILQFGVANGAIGDKFYVYNVQWQPIKISLTKLTNKSYSCFDVQSDYIWVVSSVDASNDVIYKMDLGGNLIATSPSIPKTVDATGVTYYAGYIWILRATGVIDKIRPTDFVKVATINLQYGLQYKGLSSNGGYLLAGNNDSYSKIYHIDSNNGEVVNQIYSDDITGVSSAFYISSNIYIANNNILQRVKANTVDLDIYNLRNEILLNKFVDLVDDMGVTTRVFASDFSSNRKIGYEHYYEVSMNIKKINRG